MRVTRYRFGWKLGASRYFIQRNMANHRLWRLKLSSFWNLDFGDQQTHFGVFFVDIFFPGIEILLDWWRTLCNVANCELFLKAVPSTCSIHNWLPEGLLISGNQISFMATRTRRPVSRWEGTKSTHCPRWTLNPKDDQWRLCRRQDELKKKNNWNN